MALAYQAHYLALVRLARQFVDDIESAEEAVQDVFVRLHRRRAEPSDVGYPYLRAAVLNQCRSMLRRRALARRQPRTQHVTRDARDPAAGVVERDQIRSAIGRLPRRQKEVIVLRFFEDLPLKDIAATLGISVNATSAALSRALKSISDYVGVEL